MNEPAVGAMRKRRITLADGRYLIFYTFDVDHPKEDVDSPSAHERDVTPESEESRRV
jgi:hypothetical protein